MGRSRGQRQEEPRVSRSPRKPQRGRGRGVGSGRSAAGVAFRVTVRNVDFTPSAKGSHWKVLRWGVTT